MLKGFRYNIARSLRTISFASFFKLKFCGCHQTAAQSTRLFLSVFSFQQTSMLQCTTTETWIPILVMDQWSSVTAPRLILKCRCWKSTTLWLVWKELFLHNFDTCRDYCTALNKLWNSYEWLNYKSTWMYGFTWNICICIGHLCFSNGNVRLRDSRSHFQMKWNS